MSSGPADNPEWWLRGGRVLAPPYDWTACYGKSYGTCGIRPEWLEACKRLGHDAAHGIADRGGLEACLRAWCKKEPRLRGPGVNILVHIFEQFEKVELERVELAMLYVSRAIWPMFEARAPRDAIIAAAVAANNGVLTAGELEVWIDDICRRATRPRRRA